jgi:hypothetical protein
VHLVHQHAAPRAGLPLGLQAVSRGIALALQVDMAEFDPQSMTADEEVPLGCQGACSADKTRAQG